MMNNQATSFEDPKIQLILSIMKQDSEITYHMDELQHDKAAHDMALLLRRLEINESDEEIIKLKNTITLQNYDRIPEEIINQAYEQIHDFLNRTYYKGFSNNRPRTNNKSMGDIQRTVDTARQEAGM